jgi:hypothetical protein
VPSDPVRLSRRQLLRGLGALGAAGLLVACGTGQERGDTPAAGTTPVDDPREDILRSVGVSAPATLNVVLPAAEFVSGEDRRLVFGLATDEREFLSGVEAELMVVRDDDREVVAGPVEVTTHEDFGALGVYAATVSYPGPGVYRLAVDAGDRAAVGTIQVVDPDDSPVPQVGQPFPSHPTPTTGDEQGLEELCTRDPDCSMHDHALEEVLAAGRPTVLTISTPAYCQFAICGPVVDVIERVKDDAGREDVAWIHVEVYEDAGNTPVPIVTELGLPSEPWTFFTAADGTLADKLEGPTPQALVREGLSAI